MTNKEAFKKICKNLNSYEFTDEFIQAKKQILKDLEVLDILKKYMKHDEKTGLYVIEAIFWQADKNYGEYWQEHNEEYRKIKECLKNE